MRTLAVQLALALTGSAVAAAGTPAFAEGTDRVSRLYRSAYFLGRGDTGIALADDEDAIFYNPAGVAQGKGIYKRTVLASPTVEFSENSRDLGRRLSRDNADAVQTVLDQIGKPNHVGVTNFTGLVLRRAALGAFASGNLDLLAYKSPDQGGMGVVEASAEQNAGGVFTLADGFFSNTLTLGVTAKYLMRGKGVVSASAADAEAVKETLKDTSDFVGVGQGGGADIGLMYQAGGRSNPSFGLTVTDVGDTKITPEEETSLDLDVKQTINAGVAIEPGTKFSKLRLLADYRDIQGAVITNPRKRVHIGAELSVLDAVGITGGLNQGYATGGFYVSLYVLRLDAGFYTEEIGERVGTRPDTRYFVRLKAGF